MRESLAAVALIRRREGGSRLWFVRWNSKWGSYFFVGGHKRQGESYRDCVIREMIEELGLKARDFRVAPGSGARRRFTAWSRRARSWTRYQMALFEVRLRVAARRQVDADPQNRWLSDAEAMAGKTADGRPVSETMARLIHRRAAE
jgi:8-oxo-dGTP pyrophosphatase MutT (NUDIX family)